MNTFLVSSGTFVLGFLLTTSSASAQPRLVRALPAGASTAPALTATTPDVVRRQRVAIDLAALPQPAGPQTVAALSADVGVELFEGRVATVRLQRVTVTPAGASYLGSIAGGGTFTAARAGAAFVADIALDGARYELRVDGGAAVLLERGPGIDVRCGDPIPPEIASPPRREAPRAPIVSPLGETIDMLVAFTPQSVVGAGGSEAAQALALLGVQTINANLERSLVQATVRLAGTVVSTTDESGRYEDMLRRATFDFDGFMDDVAVRREQVAADVVALVVESSDPQYGGLGYLMANASRSSAALAYSINYRPSFTYIISHELGHNAGLQHDRANATSTPFRPYAYGYQELNNFYTIMAYPCLFCQGIPYYSNPDVRFNGVRTGVADFADEARALRENIPFVAAYRGCPVQVFPLDSLDPAASEAGGTLRLRVDTPVGCGWSLEPAGTSPWITTTTPMGSGPATVTFTVAPLPAGETGRYGNIEIEGRFFAVGQLRNTDRDSDGLPDWWEDRWGFNLLPAAPEYTAGGDPDGDGRTNAQELADGTHPLGFYTRYLAEGSVNTFFDTQVNIFVPGTTGGRALVRFLQPGAPPMPKLVGLVGRYTSQVLPILVPGVVTDFATIVESDVPIVVDRTMTWDRRGYGSHAETAVDRPSTTWYLAEGSTSGPFSLFYLLQNPGTAAATATVRYLRPAGQPPVERTYALGANARLTIPVDAAAPELASTDVSAVITSTQPIIVERAMYLDAPGQPFAAGHESAGVTAPATRWFLAEGATGPWFDLFILLANPSTSAAEVDVDYLLPNGTTYRKHYAVAPESRFTIWVDDEQIPAGSGVRPLASTAVSSTIASTNGVPIIVERTMWWPGPEVTTSFWTEAHNSAGATATGTAWALAGGEVDTLNREQTFVLIANTSPVAGEVRVTVCLDDFTLNDQRIVSRTLTVPANSRTTIDVGAEFPEARRRRFGTIVESLGATPAQIVVERAMYASPGGVTWAAGTNVLATKLQ